LLFWPLREPVLRPVSKSRQRSHAELLLSARATNRCASFLNNCCHGRCAHRSYPVGSAARVRQTPQNSGPPCSTTTTPINPLVGVCLWQIRSHTVPFDASSRAHLPHSKSRVEAFFLLVRVGRQMTFHHPYNTRKSASHPCSKWRVRAPRDRPDLGPMIPSILLEHAERLCT